MRKTYPFDPLIEAIVTARDPDALTKALQDFCRRFGFLYFAYLRLDGSRWRAVSNYPQEWQERYYTLNYSRVDPVVHAVKQGVQPFCWSLDDTVLDQERRDVRAFRDDARAHGIIAGFSIPVRVGFSHHSVLTFASSDTLCLRSAMTLDAIEAATTAAMLHLAFTQAKNRWSKTSSTALTPFELICLRWIAEGKSMQDVADLLEQKYSTVRVSVDKARGKLDAVTLQQATAVATRLALI